MERIEKQTAEALEYVVEVDEEGRLELDARLPVKGPRLVRVVVMPEEPDAEESLREELTQATEAATETREDDSEEASHQLTFVVFRSWDHSERRRSDDDHFQLSLWRPSRWRKSLSRPVVFEAFREREASDDLPEREWLSAASSNPAFSFLADPEEDVYGPEDGEPFVD